VASPLSMGIVGAGAMGAKHARTLASLPGVRVARIIDRDIERARAVAAEVQAQASATCRDLPGTASAAVVAVPASEHHAVACELLRAGVHLLVEKPLAADAAQAEELRSLAHHHGCLLQVGHIERFNPAFHALHKAIVGPRFLRFERRSPFTGRGTDVDVFCDLMIHDLDLALALTGAPVRSVEARAWPPPPELAHVGWARLVFEDGVAAEFFATRLAAAPARTIQVISDGALGEADLLTRAVRILRGPADGQVAFRAAEGEDALRSQDRAFLDALTGRGPVPVDGEAGVRAVRLTERVRSAAGGSR